MRPEDIEALVNATLTKRAVFRFLHEAARPDSDFIGWYEPAIGEQGREPDFVLFGNQPRPFEIVYWGGPREGVEMF